MSYCECFFCQEKRTKQLLEQSKESKIMTIHQLNYYMVCIFMYKYHHSQLPAIFDNMFITNDTIYSYSTRQRIMSQVPTCRLETKRNSLCFILEWTNSLYASSGTLICPSLCPRHVGRNNYVPLFGVDPIEWRLTRYYVIRDVIVIFEC